MLKGQVPKQAQQLSGKGGSVPEAAVEVNELANPLHKAIRAELAKLGATTRMSILYGGSVNLGNVGSLVAEAEVDGVLVGGASLDPDGWAKLIELR